MGVFFFKLAKHFSNWCEVFKMNVGLLKWTYKTSEIDVGL